MLDFFSFEQKVLPQLNKRGIAALGMKPICGHGEPVAKGVFTATEFLRYAMSLPVATTISGVSEMHILEQNLQIAQGFTPMTGVKYDGDVGRQQHNYPTAEELPA